MIRILLLLISFNFCLNTTKTQAQKKIKVLIVDGQNNHDHWPKITYMLRQYMHETKKFDVQVARTKYTWKGNEYLEEYKIEGISSEPQNEPVYDSTFAPKFNNYDVVVLNMGWRASSWPHKTQNKFEKYVKKGGGVVVIHAANNSFPEWKAFNEIIGIGGWGDRNEKSGPYVYLNESGEVVRDTSKGPGGSHGEQKNIVIDTRDTLHPIMKDLPTKWVHSKDELYNGLRGPALNLKILASSFDDKSTMGSGRHEPVLMTINYGKGRIFHTILGHADYSVEGVGFITTFLRGVQWTAKRKVDIPVPSDFPTVDKSSSRPFQKAQ